MVHYVVQIAQGILDLLAEAERLSGPNSNDAVITPMLRPVVPRCRALAVEMQRLDPRDFIPEGRHEFVITQMDLVLWTKQWNEMDTGTFVNQFYEDPLRSRASVRDLLNRVVAVLGKYGGDGWRVQTREFLFVKDDELRKIVQRDYKELALVLFPGGAWKSTVVLAGSIIEAILVDKIELDPPTAAKAMASQEAPKRKGGAAIPIDEWNLEHLIEVGADIGVIPKTRAEAFDQSLRHYRNYVHPKREIKEKYPCQEGEAEMAKGALDALHDLWA
jgi:hypothetical protein